MDYWERKRHLPHRAASRVAKRCGVVPSAVTYVLRTGRGDARIRRELAKAMGLPLEVAFPVAAEAMDAAAEPTASGAAA